MGVGAVPFWKRVCFANEPKRNEARELKKRAEPSEIKKLVMCALGGRPPAAAGLHRAVGKLQLCQFAPVCTNLRRFVRAWQLACRAQTFCKRHQKAARCAERIFPTCSLLRRTSQCYCCSAKCTITNQSEMTRQIISNSD